MIRRPLFATLGAIGLLAMSAVAEEIKLFNGKDLTGWEYVSRDKNSKAEDVWSVQDGGVLVCKGNPVGYIRTVNNYENYSLSLEWRWKPGGKGGNSGVLLHTTTPDELGIWPKSIEAQLAADNAGDIWVIGTKIKVPNGETRTKDRRTLNLTDGSEKPVGEWNRYDITCKGDTLVLKVNGDVVNEASGLSQTKGAISLQSEGTEVHFRNVVLTPLKE